MTRVSPGSPLTLVGNTTGGVNKGGVEESGGWVG